MGGYRPLGHGLHELRVAYGPGYRIYFGMEKDHVIILLAGGDKSTQAGDIKKANKYWKQYTETL